MSWMIKDCAFKPYQSRRLETPELDKRAEILTAANICGEFVDWLRQDKGILFRVEADAEHYDQHGSTVVRTVEVPADMNMEQLLAEFFEIDLDKVETERRMLLDQQRKYNALAETLKSVATEEEQ